MIKWKTISKCPVYFAVQCIFNVMYIDVNEYYNYVVILWSPQYGPMYIPLHLCFFFFEKIISDRNNHPLNLTVQAILKFLTTTISLLLCGFLLCKIFFNFQFTILVPSRAFLYKWAGPIHLYIKKWQSEKVRTIEDLLLLLWHKKSRKFILSVGFVIKLTSEIHHISLTYYLGIILQWFISHIHKYT